MWLEIYLKLITDQLEAVSLIFLVPHAFVRLNTMGFLAVVFLAMGACVLLWLDVLDILFLLFSASVRRTSSTKMSTRTHLSFGGKDSCQSYETP